MPYSEYLQWHEYSLMEPFNSTEIMLAQLTSLLFNINSKKSKSKTPLDFMISIKEEDKKVSKQKNMERNLMEEL